MALISVADVLVLPNKSGWRESELFTSPMKLFEYMASGKPVVASSLPSIREILSDNNAFLVQPNNPAELARGIETLISNPELGKKLAAQALADVAQYSWEMRAKKILTGISLSVL